MVENLLYVIDTHVLIWYLIGSERLDKKLKKQIDEVRSKKGRLLVPTIVLSEALFVAAKGRVKFNFGQLYQIVVDEPEFRSSVLETKFLKRSSKWRG